MTQGQKLALPHEYHVDKTCTILGWSPYKISTLIKAGKIKRTRKGYYDKKSVDDYKKELEERKAILRPNWISPGTGA